MRHPRRGLMCYPYIIPKKWPDGPPNFNNGRQLGTLQLSTSVDDYLLYLSSSVSRVRARSSNHALKEFLSGNTGSPTP